MDHPCIGNIPRLIILINCTEYLPVWRWLWAEGIARYYVYQGCYMPPDWEICVVCYAL